jgi:glycosyltransferase involved in cell wall biosynthesis
MQPKRLLMISTDRKIFEEGSAVRARQVEYAKEWGEVHIIIFDKTSIAETVIAPNCWAYSTQSWSKFMYPFDAMGLGRFIIEKRGITEITCQDASLTAMAGVSLKKQFQNKFNTSLSLEIQIHEDLGSPNFGYTISNKIRKTLALSYLPKADKIRVVSNRIKDYLVGSLGIPVAKITVRSITVDVEKIRSAPIISGADLHKKYPQFEKIVLMASRLEKEKNVGLAIRAWKEVIRSVPKAGLIIVGDGREKNQLKKMAVQVGLLSDDLSNLVGRETSSNLVGSGVNNSVIFEDWVDQSTLTSYYKTADVFLNTSLFEGYGMTLVEAQAVGCKIVSTDVGVAREVGARIVGCGEGEVAEGIAAELMEK